MSTGPTRTDELPSPRFPAHGCVAYRTDADCLIGDACGPFNLELVAQLRSLLPPLLTGLSERGDWLHLCQFRHSAMTSPQALQALEALLAELAAAGLVPRRTAFVIAPDVEGASLMAPAFERSYARVGLAMRCFKDETAAVAWLRG